MPIDLEQTLNMRRTEKGFVGEIAVVPLTRRVKTASGQIENSLFLAGQHAGLSDRLLMELVEIFAWDIDFAQDVRTGDTFTLVYEELLKDGKPVKTDKILAAEYQSRGEVLRAVRYADPSGHAAYYTPDGYAMRKAFMRNPVEFSRISSRFNLNRRHPILHRLRAHKGVDYAAPSGTPIRAAGDGVVQFAGRKRGYGTTIVLQHGSKYTTLYAHMSKLAGGMREGKRVKQGKIIGYVGSTGLATGPHLHYEF
ncbi:MAG: peptidoglycan DD-metalloendopeptidase family protein, partial [Gammaproteobacteria bacterium]|nr:peptidoglycan DD-metalloendopeptidase family protein [Gammaproteobacteria bacterium]